MADVSVVIGLGFGDEGKGTTVDFLTREKSAKLVVRFNGGAQAGHNVRGPDWTHHCFSQWGAGTLSGARTFLSEFMLVNPIFAFSEARHLEFIGVRDPLSLLYVSNRSPITTPFHVAMNRLKELARGKGRHGSCGMGIGETMETLLNEEDFIYAYNLKDTADLVCRLMAQQERYVEAAKKLDVDATSPAVQAEIAVLKHPSTVHKCLDLFEMFTGKVGIVNSGWLANELAAPGHVVFEGAQGVLLDEWWGFHPNTTWSTCTFANADMLLRYTDVGKIDYLGVLRTFATRHGAGLLPTESDACKRFIKHDHNVPTPWQENLRAGALDLVLAKYAVEVSNRPTGLVLTHMDAYDHRFEDVQVCMAYRGDKSHEVSVPSPAFSGSWPVVTGIGMGNGRHDLERQEKIGKAIATMKPLYETVKGHELLDHVSEALGIPIEIVSNGPRAADKERIR